MTRLFLIILACVVPVGGCEQAQPSAEADRARLNELIELNEGGGASGWRHLPAAVKAYDIARVRARERFGQDAYIDRLGWSWYGEAPGQDITIDYFLIDAAEEAGAFDRLDQLAAADSVYALWAPDDSEFPSVCGPGPMTARCDRSRGCACGACAGRRWPAAAMRSCDPPGTWKRSPGPSGAA